MAIFNNVVLLHIPKFVTKEDQMLSDLISYTQKTKGHKETLGCVEHICSLDCGDGTTGVCLCPNSSIAHIKYLQLFAYQLYLDKIV